MRNNYLTHKKGCINWAISYIVYSEFFCYDSFIQAEGFSLGAAAGTLEAVFGSAACDSEIK